MSTFIVEASGMWGGVFSREWRPALDEDEPTFPTREDADAALEALIRENWPDDDYGTDTQTTLRVREVAP